MNPTAKHPLIAELTRRLAMWRRDLARAAILRVASIWIVAVLVVGVLDFFAPLPDAVRPWVLSVFLFALVVGIGLSLRGARRFDAISLAREIDRLAQDPRRGLEAGFELLMRNPKDRGFLQTRTVADAQLNFADVPLTACRPRELLKRRRYGFGGVMALALVVMMLQPSATPVIAARLLMPWSDIPPYSPLRFVVEPRNPAVIYGGGIELTAHVSGGEIKQPVVLRTRSGGVEESALCFRASGDQFSQRIEGAVQHMEFCFASGNARSKWKSLNVLMEPRFAFARAEVLPPAYTGTGVREFLLGNEPLRVLEGSRVRVTITSNRPLRDGAMSLEPDGDMSKPPTVVGALTGVHTAVFEFAPNASGVLSFVIRDVQGTASPEPLEVRLQTLPDERPTVVLHEPAPYSLATSDAVISVSGSASDDHGLQRVALVRTLEGRRDRALTLDEGNIGRKTDFRSALELRALGVVPGEVIEVYAEGEDNNPGLTGYESSGVARIEIISSEEYAEMIRSQTRIEELTAKFEQIQKQIAAVADALAETRKAAEPNDGAEDVDARLDVARKASQEAAEFFEQVSEEFAAFELEENAKDGLKAMSETMDHIRERTRALTPTVPGFVDEVRALEERLGQNRESLAPALTDADKALRIAALMEKAASFHRLLEIQRHLERLMQREAVAADLKPRLLDALASDQRDNRERMRELADAILEAADALDESEPDEAKLAGDARGFVEALEGCGAGESMESAGDAAGNHQPVPAHADAAQAVRQLEQLLRDRCEGGNCSFASLTLGMLPPRTRPDMESILSQLLAACMNPGRGPGPGFGAGGSGVGVGGDGYWMPGTSPMALPVMGPSRMSFRTSPGGIDSTTGGNASGGLATHSALNEENLARVESAQSQEQSSGGDVADRQVPEKYRAAIRRFFTTEEQP